MLIVLWIVIACLLFYSASTTFIIYQLLNDKKEPAAIDTFKPTTSEFKTLTFIIEDSKVLTLKGKIVEIHKLATPNGTYASDLYIVEDIDHRFYFIESCNKNSSTPSGYTEINGSESIKKFSKKQSIDLSCSIEIAFKVCPQCLDKIEIKSKVEQIIDTELGKALEEKCPVK